MTRTSTMTRPLVISTALWTLLVAVAFWARPLMPVDETRYLAVAWEMWRDGNFLVPHLNGETYSHKPPLLFWLMHGGWAVFGVNEWWPRLVAPLFGLVTLFLTTRLARVLWPDQPFVTRTAPLILIGTVFFALFTTLTMFDMMLAAFTMVGLLGVTRAARAETPSQYAVGFLMLGVAIGLGVLAKGPAILLHTLPVTLLAPWWMRGGEGDGLAHKPLGGWLAWHGGLLAALLIGAAIALAWAIPAGLVGGEAYRNAIFWGQSAGRITNSFAHQRSWWWYGASLPMLMLPWAVWPALWQAGWRALRRTHEPLAQDTAIRFLLSWMVPAFVVFSAISGKQFHYLLPEFPALALLMAFLLSRNGVFGKNDLMLPGCLLAALGIAGLVLPSMGQGEHLPEAMEPLWFGLLLVGGAGLALLPRMARTMSGAGHIIALASAAALLVATTHLVARPELGRAFDTGPLSRHLAQLQKDGVPIAHYGVYLGQFHFAGRMETTLTALTENPETVQAWAQAHSDGFVLAYREQAPADADPALVWPFRGKYAVLWPSVAMVAEPRRVQPQGLP